MCCGDYNTQPCSSRWRSLFLVSSLVPPLWMLGTRMALEAAGFFGSAAIAACLKSIVAAAPPLSLCCHHRHRRLDILQQSVPRRSPCCWSSPLASCPLISIRWTRSSANASSRSRCTLVLFAPLSGPPITVTRNAVLSAGGSCLPGGSCFVLETSACWSFL